MTYLKAAYAKKKKATFVSRSLLRAARASTSCASDLDAAAPAAAAPAAPASGAAAPLPLAAGQAYLNEQLLGGGGDALDGLGRAGLSQGLDAAGAEDGAILGDHAEGELGATEIES